MLLLRRAAGFAALLPALLACGAPELLARALGCDDANTALANTAPPVRPPSLEIRPAERLQAVARPCS